MPTDTFEAALLAIVAPRLQPLGYEYEPALRVAAEMFGFRKVLDRTTQVILQFQRQAETAIDRFTVNVLRVPAAEVHPRVYGGAQARAARLGYVLWYVYDVRQAAVADCWWTAATAAERAAALHDAAEQLAQYGVPWAEAAEAVRPWEMPANRAVEFGAAVQAVLARALERRGYHARQQTLPGDLPYCYFSKALPDGTYALIELQTIYSLDPQEFNFDVRLQQRADDDPLAYEGNYGQWCSVSLAQLAWQARGGAPLDRLSVSDAKTLFWHYRDRAELDAQLREALAQIEQIGCAWVEQAAAADTIK